MGKIIIFILLCISWVPTAKAEVIFSSDSYSYTIDNNLPNPPFCSTGCGTGSSEKIGVAKAASSCDPAANAPLGGTCFYWDVGDQGASTSTGSGFLSDTNRTWGTDQWTNHKLIDSAGTEFTVSSSTACPASTCQLNVTGTPASGTYTLATKAIYNLIAPSGGMAHTVNEGDSIFLAFQVNYTRLLSCTHAGRPDCDVWEEGDLQSGDKGVGINCSNLSDCRWDVSFGQWSSLCANTNNKYTVWMGNPTNHFNEALEFSDILRPNQGGYGAICSGTDTTAPQLDYERWYNFVAQIQFADASPKNGLIRLWMNGTLIEEYTEIQTFNLTSAEASVIEFGGTIAQPAYDAPKHERFFGRFMVATASSDVAWAMVDPEVAGSSIVGVGD